MDIGNLRIFLNVVFLCILRQEKLILYTNLELASVDECVIAVVHSEPVQFPFLKNKKN
jgi:hypothetical protein